LLISVKKTRKRKGDKERCECLRNEEVATRYKYLRVLMLVGEGD
jgi:hypothetical protein